MRRYAILDNMTPEERRAQSVADDQDAFQRERYRKQKKQQFKLEQAEELMRRTGQGGGAAGVSTSFNPNPNALRLGGNPINPVNLYSQDSAISNQMSQLKLAHENTMKLARAKFMARSGMAEGLTELFGEDYYAQSVAPLVNERDQMVTMVMRRVYSQKMRERDYVQSGPQRLREVDRKVRRLEDEQLFPLRKNADAIFNSQRASAEISQAEAAVEARRQKEIDMMTQDPFFYL